MRKIIFVLFKLFLTDRIQVVYGEKNLVRICSLNLAIKTSDRLHKVKNTVRFGPLTLAVSKRISFVLWMTI